MGAATYRGSGIDSSLRMRLYWEGTAGGPRDAEDLMEEDWRPFWRESLASFRVSERIELASVWEESQIPEGVRRYLIDPGMAFGAGDHPTTRLCVSLIERLAQRGALSGEVLDVGSGTGVLSLVAADLCATKVCALDIDPFCYASCRRNIALNNLDARVTPRLLSPDLIEGGYPLILINMAKGQLRALAQTLIDRLAPEGALLLSGFNGDGEDEVMGALEATGAKLKISDRITEDGWVATILRY